MKLLLLVCVSLVAGAPTRQEQSLPTSVYDYYDFVEIPRSQPLASSRSDSLIARSSGPLPRRITLPLPPRRPPPPVKPRSPFHGARPQKPNRPFREPDYQLAEAEGLKTQFRERPKYQRPRPQPQYQPRPLRPIVREPEPQFFDYDEYVSPHQDEAFYPLDESVFVEEPQIPKKSPIYQKQRPITRNRDYPVHEEAVRQDYHEPRRQEYQEERPQYQDDTLQYPEPAYDENPWPQFSKEKSQQYLERPKYQRERQPIVEEEKRRPLFHEERQPQYEERRPLYQEEQQPEYVDGGPLYQERQPQYHEEIHSEYEEKQPVYPEVPQYQEERPPYDEEVPRFDQPSKKDRNRLPLNDYSKTKEKASEPVKEKRDAIHDGGGHFDANGVKFAADAAAVENAKGAGRLAFQIHGQQGPHSYRFGYDTGKGHNRQFRYEEKDGNGMVHGRYGFYDKDGKLQVVNYSAHPEHGYSADVPH